MELTAKRKPWKLVIKKDSLKNEKKNGEHFYLEEIGKMQGI